MKVIKRDGSEVEFDQSKIVSAVSRANKECGSPLSSSKITIVVGSVVDTIARFNRAISVEEIQEEVETFLMEYSPEVAKHYIRYRYEHKLMRESTLDKKVMSLVEYNNEEVKQENSNKNPQIIPTQRDYIAGEISKDITMKKLLPKEIVEAHNAGIIHFHDSDYFIQHMHNCCLINLEDMLQNGTVISGTKIDRPHSFSTACTIATQIIAQVASHQYGGQSISLAHLVPFISESRNKFKKQYKQLLNYMPIREYNDIVEDMVRADIERGIQTLQYQIITLMTTNGQAPFITLYMNIKEVSEEYLDDMAMAIEEVLNQRIKGVKNEDGIYITTAFPKLIYALDECNIYPDSPFYELTELAAKCSAKRLVPDYISNKVENRVKKAEYPCMGCRSFLTTDRTHKNYAKARNWKAGKKYYGRLTA